MWADCANVLLGTVLLIFATDSLANGVSGWVARKRAETYPVALTAAFVAALAPALALGVAAVLAGQTDLVLGGLVGGAIAQIGVLLGVAALLAPLLARLKLLAWLNPMLPVAVVLAWGLGLDHGYSRLDGAVLVLAFVIAVVLVLRSRASGSDIAGASFGPAPVVSGGLILGIRVLVGLALTGIGAWLLVAGSMGLAAALSLNPLILGLFVLGLACALAGLPTALMAARRGRGDFVLVQGLLGALGNILLLLGALALWQPLAAPESLSRIELPVLLALAVALYPMTRSDGALSRREGGVLLAIYAVLVLGELWLTTA